MRKEKKYSQQKFIVIIGLTLTLYCCTDTWLAEKYNNNPLSVFVFDAVWDDFDKNYGAFEAKHINWDSCRIVYRKKLTNMSNDVELHALLCSLFTNLNDGHVQLMAPNLKRFYSSIIYPIFYDSQYYENSYEINILLTLIKNLYLINTSESENFFYGSIPLQNILKKIGYLYIPTFQNISFQENLIKEALRDFKTKDALIIDLRFNRGGTLDTYTNLLNYFTDKKRLYLKSKIRNGIKHTDFINFIDHYMVPNELRLYNKPIILLTNRFTASSANILF